MSTMGETLRQLVPIIVVVDVIVILDFTKMKQCVSIRQVSMFLIHIAYNGYSFLYVRLLNCYTLNTHTSARMHEYHSIDRAARLESLFLGIHTYVHKHYQNLQFLPEQMQNITAELLV